MIFERTIISKFPIYPYSIYLRMVVYTNGTYVVLSAAASGLLTEGSRPQRSRHAMIEGLLPSLSLGGSNK